ncbi:MAG: ABC transporter ATP-binding protein [Clostridiales bacterium]|nr:ABC transporter ATP-binding protein [Clostridiales bacterium]
MMNVETKGLTYQPSGTKRPILSDVSYTFSQGSLTALLGPNGSGKTTMLKHFLAQIRSPEGAVLIDGKDSLSYSPKERSRILAWVPQNSSGESAFTVEDVVLMARYPYKGTWDDDSKEDIRIAEEAMETVGVLEFRNRDFTSLSGGERQRALIARALTQTTPWIFLDEPTSNLDVKHQIHIMQVLRERVDQKKTSAIVVMHDFNLVEKYCDRAIMLKEGRVVAKGETSEVLTPELLREVYEVEFEVFEREGQRFFVPKTEN